MNYCLGTQLTQSSCWHFKEDTHTHPVGRPSLAAHCLAGTEARPTKISSVCMVRPAHHKLLSSKDWWAVPTLRVHVFVHLSLL